MDRGERVGLGVAIVAHALLLGVLSLSIVNKPKPLPKLSDPIDVQLVEAIAPRSAAPVVSQDAPAPSAAPDKGPPEDAAPEPAPPEPTPTRPTEPAPPEPAPPKPALPKPTPPKPTPPKPKPTPVKPTPPPKPTPKPAPKPKPTPPVEKPTKPAPAKPAPAKPAPTKPTPAKASPAKAAPAKHAPDKSAPAKPGPAKATAGPAKPATKPGAGKGTKTRGGIESDDFLKGITPEKSPGHAQTPRAAMTGAQANALAARIREQLKPYWSAPAGTDVAALVTSLRVRLNRDGSLAGPPEVIGQSGVTDSNRLYLRQHADAARRAVARAVPLKGLPPEFYDEWKVLEPLNFDNRLSQ